MASASLSVLEACQARLERAGVRDVGNLLAFADDPEVIVEMVPGQVAARDLPGGLVVRGSYGRSVSKAGVHAVVAEGSVKWHVDGRTVDPVFVDGSDPIGPNRVVVHTRVPRPIPASAHVQCRVQGRLLLSNDSTPCANLLGKRPSANLAFSHPFAAPFTDRVISVDVLCPASKPFTAPVVSCDVAPVVLDALEGSTASRVFHAIPDVAACVSLASGLVLSPTLVDGQRLYNIHRRVRPSGIEFGKTHLVRGPYAYYHYLQDGFNDDGWGCAYRSLQTLWSWGNFQGCLRQPVPSHREIQEILARIEDKPSNFVGSKQWIGAYDVSLILNEVGLVCKLLNLTSGAEFATRGRELAMHFDTHGSPVTIGGGVLAYTLLGVDINEFTGDVRFLILDPHYKGADDVDTIVSKGWCAWHSADLFLRDTFYNLCMPQKPTPRPES
ncbi:unnamed protein product (mitochondrion) [Plasmodiophora brassicae]|uniref:UFSP1/2/DUB catalytic domain-containing protein n=1 Tax=Plasmodiophora brassicae TaxID=37360 RepID=A0A3P3YG50_PLABS|nr:unnamed protein product [Plasmodiophora brassicae]